MDSTVKKEETSEQMPFLKKRQAKKRMRKMVRKRERLN